MGGKEISLSALPRGHTSLQSTAIHRQTDLRCTWQPWLTIVCAAVHLRCHFTRRVLILAFYAANTDIDHCFRGSSFALSFYTASADTVSCYRRFLLVLMAQAGDSRMHLLLKNVSADVERDRNIYILLLLLLNSTCVGKCVTL